MNFNPVELIIKKKTGKSLSRLELKYFIESYLDNKLPEYQMSALLMAINFQGMEIEEIQALTEIYIESGKKITFPASYNTVDKHSTGGVGDKISIVLAPIIAACGRKIPMISGRGLGHTGGTLDKLESIPGFRTDLSEEQFKKNVEKIGFSIIGQSDELIPADRRIYALRGVTGTVDSLPLITASIMSKKIAEGAQNLVIDLKIGAGAFIKNIETANELANLLIETGKKFSQKVSVIFSNMNSPLGEYAGNTLEIRECIEYLKGKNIPDIGLLTKTLASEMLLLTDITLDKIEAEAMINKSINNGTALESFRKFIKAQGGNHEVCDNPSVFPQAKYEIPIISDNEGCVESIDTQNIGYALIDIGAGRKTLDSKLNYASGTYLPKKIGNYVRKGEQIGKVFCDEEECGKEVAKKILESYKISNIEVKPQKLIIKVIRYNN